jgi:hypothetical protein
LQVGLYQASIAKLPEIVKKSTPLQNAVFTFFSSTVSAHGPFWIFWASYTFRPALRQQQEA